MCLGELAQVLCLRGPEAVDVRGAGRRLTVSLLTLEDPRSVAVGDRLLVHSGYALARLSAQEAADAERIREATEGST